MPIHFINQFVIINILTMKDIGYKKLQSCSNKVYKSKVIRIVLIRKEKEP